MTYSLINMPTLPVTPVISYVYPTKPNNFITILV